MPLFGRVSAHAVLVKSLRVTIFISLIEFGILGRLSLGISVRTLLEGLPEEKRLALNMGGVILWVREPRVNNRKMPDDILLSLLPN